LKFRFSEDFIIDTDRAPWSVEGLRVAFFGAPGSGKSLTCAVLVEQFLDQGGTVVIFEPRYEWETLKQNYPVQVAGGPYADLPLAPNQYRLYAEAVVKNGLSLVVNTGDREVLRYYRDYGLDVKATQLLNIPVGSWLVIYAGKAETVTITEKRKTPHGAETPKLEYTAPVTAEIQQTVSELARMLEAELEKARLEESELEKAKRRASELESRVAELQEKLKVKETLTEIFSGVKVNGELKERIFEPEKRLKELESENAALKAEVEKNRRVPWTG